MHFGHQNIIEYENRPFDNADQMTRTLVKNWNKVVQRDDEVFCLGDICFRNKEITTENKKPLLDRDERKISIAIGKIAPNAINTHKFYHRLNYNILLPL